MADESSYPEHLNPFSEVNINNRTVSHPACDSERDSNDAPVQVKRKFSLNALLEKKKIWRSSSNVTSVSTLTRKTSLPVLNSTRQMARDSNSIEGHRDVFNLTIPRRKKRPAPPPPPIHSFSTSSGSLVDLPSDILRVTTVTTLEVTSPTKLRQERKGLESCPLLGVHEDD